MVDDWLRDVNLSRVVRVSKAKHAARVNKRVSSVKSPLDGDLSVLLDPAYLYFEDIKRRSAESSRVFAEREAAALRRMKGGSVSR